MKADLGWVAVWLGLLVALLVCSEAYRPALLVSVAWAFAVRLWKPENTPGSS